MESNNRSVFQDHLKYIWNDIVKTFRVGIIYYAERIEEMHNLSNHLPPSLMKCDGYE